MTTDNAPDNEQNAKYDEGYKDILSQKDRFVHFLKKYINEPWTADITAENMEKIDKSFVTSEYREIHSDLIYKLRMNDNDVYFYVLLEMQSEVDYTMPYRLLKYISELLTDIFEDTDKIVRERKGFRLPAVVPIILYNGDDNWTAVKSYREYTENHEVFGDSVINFKYLLFDLKRTDKKMISSTNELLDVIFSLDSERFDKNYIDQIFERLIALSRGLANDDLTTLIKWLKYVYYKGIVPPNFEDVFKTSIKKGDVEVMKNSYVMMIDEVRQEGRQEGGLEKQMKIARNLRAEGMDVDTVARMTGLDVDDVLKLS
jgi:predicted transposase/invertase (TIGR01784 family)